MFWNIRIERSFSLIFQFWYFKQIIIYLHHRHINIIGDWEYWCVIGKEFHCWKNILTNIIYIDKKKRGSKIEPWGTPAQTGSHKDYCPFKTLPWSLLLKKLSMSLKELHVMPMRWIESNACERSKKILLTSFDGLQSKYLEISCGISGLKIKILLVSISRLLPSRCGWSSHHLWRSQEFLLKFTSIELVIRSWTAENQSLGGLSKQQNLQRERCIEG